MAYDEALADRIRDVLGETEELLERKMFGGLAFLLNGHMVCGVVGEDLCLRLGEVGARNALEQPHTRPMDFTGKPMKSMVYVEPAGIEAARDLQRWVQHAARFVRTLPPK